MIIALTRLDPIPGAEMSRAGPASAKAKLTMSSALGDPDGVSEKGTVAENGNCPSGWPMTVPDTVPTAFSVMTPTASVTVTVLKLTVAEISDDEDPIC